jgi:hypothetical protein
MCATAAISVSLAGGGPGPLHTPLMQTRAAGHWIDNCPSTADLRIKRAAPGIPRSSLHIVNTLDELKGLDTSGGVVQLPDGAHQAALAGLRCTHRTRAGKYAIVKPNENAFNEAMAGRARRAVVSEQDAEPVTAIPPR